MWAHSMAEPRRMAGSLNRQGILCRRVTFSSETGRSVAKTNEWNVIERCYIDLSKKRSTKPSPRLTPLLAWVRKMPTQTLERSSFVPCKHLLLRMIAAAGTMELQALSSRKHFQKFQQKADPTAFHCSKCSVIELVKIIEIDKAQTLQGHVFWLLRWSSFWPYLNFSSLAAQKGTPA